MYLHALATALPPTGYTQRECWELAQRSPELARLSRRSRLTLRTVLCGDSGVERRHFALPDLEKVFERSPDELNEAFRAEAPRLGRDALRQALAGADIAVSEIDVLIVCTCTGYLCPGVSSYVADHLGMRSDAQLLDLAGLGCAAALPMLRTAAAALAAEPSAIVACVAVEICSTAFYLDDDPGVILSACLFGDGAAATIWRATPGPTRLRCHSFESLHQPEHRDEIRFEMRQGKLRNLLAPTVPELAADAVAMLHDVTTTDHRATPIERIINHGGGRDVIDALARRFPDHDFGPSRHILQRCGNMSSPSVLFGLEYALRSEFPNPGADWWLTSFGAGFTAHGCRLSREL